MEICEQTYGHTDTLITILRTPAGRELKSSITLNKNSAMSHPSRFYAAPNFLKMGIKMPRFVVFWTTSTIKDEKSAAEFHYIKTDQSQKVKGQGHKVT